MICVAGTRFNDPDSIVDVLPLANAAFQQWSPVTQGVPLSGSCGWNPALRAATADSAKDVPALVVGGAPAHPSVAAAQDFGTLFLGCDVTSTITLSNTAGGPLYMGKIKATGDFSVCHDCAGQQ